MFQGQRLRQKHTNQSCQAPPHITPQDHKKTDFSPPTQRKVGHKNTHLGRYPASPPPRQTLASRFCTPELPDCDQGRGDARPTPTSRPDHDAVRCGRPPDCLRPSPNLHADLNQRQPTDGGVLDTARVCGQGQSVGVDLRVEEHLERSVALDAVVRREPVHVQPGQPHEFWIK